MAEQTVTGYRQQTPEKIDLVNRIKHQQAELGRLYAELAEQDDVNHDDLREGRKRYIEAGSWWTRAVFQPDDAL